MVATAGSRIKKQAYPFRYKLLYLDYSICKQKFFEKKGALFGEFEFQSQLKILQTLIFTRSGNPAEQKKQNTVSQ
ncbi:hypothetical protein SAMN05421827_101508 [Pedobacter terrae]|uniref:Uncharacterized protein n=1 Tax=Pedobacter terrae TaxID=405671 RepID=A0A1G7NUI5_9SPHI|nr:hypothetical protein SAMN05421827_101508 [Pedobacter terrae]